MIRAHIQSYMDFHCTVALKQRGKELYEDSRVSALTIDNRLDVAFFIVAGTNDYDVRINGFNKKA